MPNFKATNIDLVVNNKTIQIKNPQKGNFELNKALLDPAGFKKFALDPKTFVAGYGLDIDKDLSTHLSSMVGGFSSLQDLKMSHLDLTQAAVAWAVASGSYSVASSKIAVAF